MLSVASFEWAELIIFFFKATFCSKQSFLLSSKGIILVCIWKGFSYISLRKGIWLVHILITLGCCWHYMIFLLDILTLTYDIFTIIVASVLIMVKCIWFYRNILITKIVWCDICIVLLNEWFTFLRSVLQYQCSMASNVFLYFLVLNFIYFSESLLNYLPLVSHW